MVIELPIDFKGRLLQQKTTDLAHVTHAEGVIVSMPMSLLLLSLAFMSL